ncbi:MAG: GNAT family protein [Bacteroidales bacterium]|nr:GNAT family protein [Bacteroidales bacterium]
MKQKDTIVIRDAEYSDVDIYYRWVEDPLVRLNSFYSDEITYKDHVSWYSSKISDINTFMYIFEINKQFIGQVRIEKKDSLTIGISIDKEFRGQGYGTRIIHLALDRFYKESKDQSSVFAYIRSNNTASVKVFELAGFSYFKDDKVNGIDCKVLVFSNK